MIENIKWLFFDVGSTLIDEHLAYEHRMREIAEDAGPTFEKVYELGVKVVVLMVDKGFAASKYIYKKYELEKEVSTKFYKVLKLKIKK